MLREVEEAAELRLVMVSPPEELVVRVVFMAEVAAGAEGQLMVLIPERVVMVRMAWYS
jgi:hypothetical protein